MTAVPKAEEEPGLIEAVGQRASGGEIGTDRWILKHWRKCNRS